MGLGGRCAVGRYADAIATAVRAGITRLQEHEYMVDNAGDPFRVAYDPALTTPTRRARVGELAESALNSVLADLETRRYDRAVPLLLCLPSPCDTWTQADRMWLMAALVKTAEARQLELRPQLVSASGNAAGAVGLQLACEQVRKGECCILLGADSFIDPDVLEPLDEAAELMSLTNKWGFPPGEGAAALLLVETRRARSMSLRPIAEIHGLGVTRESNPKHSDGICTGVGLSQAFAAAVRGLGGPVDWQYCDIDGDRYREHEFSFALQRAHASMFADATGYVSAADCWGAVGAATIPLLSLLAITPSLRTPAGTAMVWAGSEDGLRGSIVYRCGAGR